jgi:hypothetical protein
LAVPFTLENKSGRFIEICFYGALSLEDVTALRTRLWTLLSQVPGRAVIWADLRHTELFAPEVAVKLIEMLRVDNPKVERSAYPVGGRAAFALQVERIVDEAKGVGKTPPRRTFRDLHAAGEWLKEVLTDPAEQLRVDALVEVG